MRRVFQTGGYAAFFSICLSCFVLRIVFHYGPVYQMGNASAPPSPRFEMLSSIFLCDYLSSGETQHEVHEGLNVVENWNATNDFICYGRQGELATNSREQQEIVTLSLAAAAELPDAHQHDSGRADD